MAPGKGPDSTAADSVTTTAGNGHHMPSRHEELTAPAATKHDSPVQSTDDNVLGSLGGRTRSGELGRPSTTPRARLLARPGRVSRKARGLVPVSCGRAALTPVLAGPRPPGGGSVPSPDRGGTHATVSATAHDVAGWNRRVRPERASTRPPTVTMSTSTAVASPILRGELHPRRQAPAGAQAVRGTLASFVAAGEIDDDLKSQLSRRLRAPVPAGEPRSPGTPHGAHANGQRPPGVRWLRRR